MARPHWERDNDFFAFAVAFTEVPLRMVHISQVVAINGVELVKPDRQRTETRTFYVENSKGTGKYKVTERAGIWHCDCSGFQFRKHCRHIGELKGTK